MWIFYAIMASILWGATYVIKQMLFERISIYSYYALLSLSTFVISLLLAIQTKTLTRDLVSLVSARNMQILLYLAVLIHVAAEICIAQSIVSKNATLAGLIEISYPLFIAIFTWLLLGQSYLSVPVVVGGLLIVSGVSIISFFSR